MLRFGRGVSSATAAVSAAGLRASTAVPAVTAVAAAGLATQAKNKTFTFDLKNSFETFKCEGPATTVEATKDDLLGFYRLMVRMRRMEMEADRLYKEALIRGFCHLYIGQEAVATGLDASLDPDDHVITAYRAHCQQLTRGDTVKGVLAELLGRVAGSSKGKGGSMHMYWKHFYGGNGIVGAQVPLGAGVALALKQQGKKNIVHAMYGDGAANQGQVFEAFNMAKLWSLPVVFICENNHFGMGTAEGRAAANTKFFTRGDYIPGLKVDGMDVLAVREAGRYARKHALEKGPIVLEMDTYRYQGHSMSDPGVAYRTREDVDKVKAQRDCLDALSKRIYDNGIATEADLKAITNEERAFIAEQSKEAQASAEPSPEALIENVYIEPSSTTFIRNTEYPTSWFPAQRA